MFWPFTLMKPSSCQTQVT